MKAYFNKLIKYFFKLKSKIAFYPTLLSLAGLAFALFMFYCESKGISGYLLDNAPVLVVNDTETARSLLTTFIAGLISIMVFSFSMVMILLNQASSNFSPRILPGLISNKRHQIVLGIYNFNLLYCIFTLVAIEPNGSKYQLPGFSVLLAIFGMTFCLAAFIYFIHSISQEIQVNNIMDGIFNTAKNRLNKLIDSEKKSKTNFPNTDEWLTISAKRSGYFQDLDINSLREITRVHNLKLETIPVKGQYMLKGMPLFKADNNIEDKLKDDICESFMFSRSELIKDNYLLAFKQITEIAVKAMSPGINDPGTAINAIDYLTELFEIRLKKKDSSIIFNKNDNPVIKIRTVDFNDLLFQVMAALRTYCMHDIIIIQKLNTMLEYLIKSDSVDNKSYIEALEKERDNLLADASNTLTSETDIKLILKIKSNFND